MYTKLLLEQRQMLLTERFQAEMSLSWSFWYHIYNNDVQTYAGIQSYFDSPAEQNPAVKRIPITHAQELNVALSMVQHYNQSPVVGFWYCFWHDVWSNNQDISSIRNAEDKLSPLR